jgi:subtilisin family serine protease
MRQPARATLLALVFGLVAMIGGSGQEAQATPRTVSVIVTLRDQVVPGGGSRASRDVVSALRAKAATTQGRIRRVLAARSRAGLVARVRPLWIVNGLAITATPAVVRELAALPEVRSIHSDRLFAGPEIQAAPAAEPNIALVNAPALWDMGIRGQGVVVASVDTGVDLGHPDLAQRWRGGSNSWYDPNGEHPDVPTDVNGHGTATTGVMVGGDAGGTAVGVAPEAQWIAAKIFDDHDVARASLIHAAYQWLLDPDGDPTTADAPDVVNNSWSFSVPGCDLEFAPDIAALRAAGILPVFAAGNGGPGAATSMSPANNPGALAVGASSSADALWAASSRGPSACGEPETVFPELVAPGVDVHAPDLFGLYRNLTGTSVAAPHVSGALALLLGAFPELTAGEAESALEAAAVDLGPVGPDGDYAYGRLDVLGAYERLRPPDGPLVDVSTRGSPDVLRLEDVKLSLLFDGSDVGFAAADVDALAELDDHTLLLSFNRRWRLPGVGRVASSDVVAFDAASLGEETAGVFSLYFDGSDVGLAARSEDIDALEVLTDGRLLVSTSGRAAARDVRARDEDLLAFSPTSLGPTTRGRWQLYLDGSDIGLGSSGEDVDAVSTGDDGELYLSTRGAFAVEGLAGGNDDVFICMTVALGRDSVCTYSPTLLIVGGSLGIGDVDALEVTARRGAGDE